MNDSKTSGSLFGTVYDDIIFKPISGRYLSPEDCSRFLNFFNDVGIINIEGSSVENRNIESICIGNGAYKVLAWSQMHGNESTTTKAVFDLLSYIKHFKGEPNVKKLLEAISLTIIPQLNPDGCKAYTRENANAVDLNRDAEKRTQPESKVLRRVYDRLKPDLCLNLHDQRSIYNVLGTKKPATVSFLAPSADQSRSLTKARLTAMKYILAMVNLLSKEIPGQIGRYNDAFNKNCVGDQFQMLGTPTVLFEAGHYQDDYDRVVTRKLIYIALISLLYNCFEQLETTKTLAIYNKIPENDKRFFDIILRDVAYNGHHVDIAVQYKEELNNGNIDFSPYISKIGNLDAYCGHREIDGNNQEIKINGRTDFLVDLCINELSVGNDQITFL